MSTARVSFSEDERQICRGLRTRFLEAIFDHLSDAVVLCREDLQIVGVNQDAERLFGMVAEEIIGQNCQELFHCSSCDPDSGSRRVAGESTSLPAGTFNLHVKNGRQRMVIIRAVQLRDNANAAEGVVATIKDVTEEPQPAAPRIIAESPAMRGLLSFVRKIAVSEATPVLIEGENGTGKDLIAKTLHDQSPRQAGPFLAINCAAIPETLLESELSLQVKLLRVLEDQTFRRLGGLRISMWTSASSPSPIRTFARRSKKELSAWTHIIVWA